MCVRGSKYRFTYAGRNSRSSVSSGVNPIHEAKTVFRTYVATGTWDWLGVVGSAAVMVVPGARHKRSATSHSPLRWPHDSGH